MKKILLILLMIMTSSLAEASDCKSGDIKGDAFI